ncbi:MAG TPA: peptide chain release factor N(5)-glutamine methyltransferase [Cellvibrionaceae bacterium]
MTQTVSECLRVAPSLNASSDSARLDTEILLAHSLGKTRTWLYTWPESQLTPAQLKQFERLMRARAQGAPIAYLTGVQEFWSLPLKVTEHTLIPRPETELLVELVLALSLGEMARVLDLGTGTGAIALALAHEKKHWQITAVDRIAEAVSLAEDNARTLQLSVKVLQSDWFAALAQGDVFDVIVSNPPYIDGADPHLHQGDVRFEPHSALVANAEGLADIEHIITQSGRFLAPGGWLLLEHGWQQAPAVQELLHTYGFSQVRSECDLAGHLRVSLGRWGEV